MHELTEALCTGALGRGRGIPEPRLPAVRWRAEPAGLSAAPPIVDDGRLITIMAAAAEGTLPPPDGAIEVIGPPAGACATVIAFAGHAVIASAAPEGWIREYLAEGRVDEDEHHAAVSPHFLAALSSQLGAPPVGLSNLLGAPPSSATVAGRFRAIETDPLGWVEHRVDVRSYRYQGAIGAGTISVGRGPAGRWDAEIRAHGAQQRTRSEVQGRELLVAAMTLIPQDTPLFTSVPIHSARSLRIALSAGFGPIGAEALFPVGS